MRSLLLPELADDNPILFGALHVNGLGVRLRRRAPSSATAHFLSLNFPSPPPFDPLNIFQPSRHSQLLDVLTLTVISQLHRTNVNTGFRRSTTNNVSAHRDKLQGFPCTTSVCAPMSMRPWVLHTRPVTTSKNLRVSHTVRMVARVVCLLGKGISPR